MGSEAQRRSLSIKTKARELGFLACGVARADLLEDEAPRLERWLRRGGQGGMAYMERHFDVRIDPRRLLPGAKSVISLAYNYQTDRVRTDPEAPKVSRYAFGRDYHKVLRKRLMPLIDHVQEQLGEVEVRAFVDSAPVLEKAWAERAGIGWRGKHTNVIRKGQGSWFFLCEMITDLELEPDAPATDHCGTCRRCVDACPTAAITPYGVDGSRCISYLTIELKDAIPDEFTGRMDGWAFGCDVCQEVCPWNRFAVPHSEPEFGPREGLLELSQREWVEMTEAVFERIFTGSAVKRAKFVGLRRNIDFLYRS
ncbi:MAG: tRNA epoxyqueuosine(34) reductase QueG [Flavobacteriales bacterium]|nr:tRNA epoxyqueuosine(34) reductase QueG [Flavobacteriales bacterium]MCB9166807.1 tRNA epoxyqueuosine(34) reductase QueG [Flavobacteriales bacterium]